MSDQPCKTIEDCTTPKLCLSVGTCKGCHVMPASVRSSANMREIASLLTSMFASAIAHVRGQDEEVHAYTVKTGALHKIVGILQGAGHRVVIPSNMTTAHETAIGLLSGVSGGALRAQDHAHEIAKECGLKYVTASDDYWTEGTQEQFNELVRRLLGSDIQLMAGGKPRDEDDQYTMDRAADFLEDYLLFLDDLPGEDMLNHPDPKELEATAIELRKLAAHAQIDADDEFAKSLSPSISEPSCVNKEKV